MSRLYEAMFLIDNDTVRASWQQAKASVAGLIEKHGGKVCTARRWAECRLAYPIRRRHRATYLLSYLELPPEQIPNLHRDLEINEMVLRHLLLRAEVVPAEELELSQAESAGDFVVPEPPADDAVDEPEAPPDAEPRGDAAPSGGAAPVAEPAPSLEAGAASVEATAELPTEAPKTLETPEAPDTPDTVAASTAAGEETTVQPEKTEG